MPYYIIYIYLRWPFVCTSQPRPYMCLYNLELFNTMSTIPYDIVQRRTRTPAVYWCYHCIPGEILSHFYLRQSSESPILTILEALKVNRFLGKTKYCRTQPNITLHRHTCSTKFCFNQHNQTKLINLNQLSTHNLTWLDLSNFSLFCFNQHKTWFWHYNNLTYW